MVTTLEYDDLGRLTELVNAKTKIGGHHTYFLDDVCSSPSFER
jgi:hypothetical protein